MGLGTDLVHIERFERLISRYGDRLAKKILSDEEFSGYANSVDKAGYIARRFAAKEATVKAIGTGFRYGISKKEIAVAHDENGKPILVTTGKADIFMKKLGASHAWISLSDDTHYALCTVILEN